MSTDLVDVSLNHPCGVFTAQPGWQRIRENSLSLRDHELWFVWRGEGWMQTTSGRLELRPGFCAWMRPGGIYDAGLNDGRPLGFTFIHFDCDLPNPLEFFQLTDVGYFDAVTRRIVAQVGAAPPRQWGRSARASTAANVLLRGLLLDLINEHRRPADKNGMVRRREIEAIAAEMRDWPERRRGIEEIAQSIGVTLPHFSRTFRATMGVSPRQYQLRSRLDRARHLLAESNLTIGQIADSLGYADLFFFSKQFARHTAMSPTAYRRAAAVRIPSKR